MNDELWDEKAYVCTNCLILIANGDGPDFAYQYPDKTEAEITEMSADYDRRIAERMDGYRITTGWGREQHDCASNITVWPIYRDEDGPIDREEYRFDTVSEAIEAAELDSPNAIGFRGVMHDLETEADRGGECECETDNFASRSCDHCGVSFAGTWHAATIWRIICEGSGQLMTNFPHCPVCNTYTEARWADFLAPNHVKGA